VIGIIFLYFFLYAGISWIYWLDKQTLSFKKYTLVFIFTLFVHEVVKMTFGLKT